MGEKQPRRLLEEIVTPKPNALTRPITYIDQILIGQGAELTEDNRRNLREKMDHISTHRS